MYMHRNSMQLIAAEIKNPLCILWRFRGLWILENSVSLSGILWLAETKGEHKQDLLDCFKILSPHMGSQIFLQDPGEDALLHTSSQISMDIPFNLAQWIMCQGGPLWDLANRCCWMFSQPRSLKHSRFPAELAGRFAVQKDSERKRKKRCLRWHFWKKY